MIRLADRISKCLVEYVKSFPVTKPGGSFMTLVSAVILAKCFQANLWDNSPYVSKQVRKIGQVFSKTLAENGKTTIHSILSSDPRQLETVSWDDFDLENCFQFYPFSPADLKEGHAIWRRYHRWPFHAAELHNDASNR